MRSSSVRDAIRIQFSIVVNSNAYTHGLVSFFRFFLCTCRLDAWDIFVLIFGAQICTNIFSLDDAKAHSKETVVFVFSFIFFFIFACRMLLLSFLFFYFFGFYLRWNVKRALLSSLHRKILYIECIQHSFLFRHIFVSPFVVVLFTVTTFQYFHMFFFFVTLVPFFVLSTFRFIFFSLSTKIRTLFMLKNYDIRF